ncbi:MAG: hypothetical protein QGG48_13155, partial [Desulfatiglandales bacterium]|jgi:hypothetical protein|nr:hypothetical protein [Desulfatiglandales bacterium]
MSPRPNFPRKSLKHSLHLYTMDTFPLPYESLATEAGDAMRSPLVDEQIRKFSGDDAYRPGAIPGVSPAREWIGVK